MAVFVASTNETILRYCREDSPGVISGDEDWYVLEPNDIGTFGPNITTVARDPISNDRSDRKGSITDLDAEASWDEDLTVASFRNFFDGFMFSTWKELVKADVATVTASAYTHAALTAAIAEDSLIFARELATSGNNGLKLVGAGSTTTATNVSGLTAEASPPTGARINIVGFQGDTGDIVVDADGNITSTTYTFTSGAAAGQPDFYVGQKIYVGDGTTDHTFATAGASFARIKAVEAKKLTIDKKSSTTWAADTGAGKTIRIFTGDFIKTVPIDDADFQNITYHLEAEYNNLDDGVGGVEDGFEYVIGAYPNTMTLNMSLTSFATISWGFTALDGEPIVDTAKTRNSNISPTDTDAYNTTSDFARISVKDEDGNDLGAYFRDMTLNINNNMTPQKALGTLGSLIVSVGDLNITADTEAYFTSAAISNAVRYNTTITMDWVLENDDGGLAFDVPSATLGNSAKSFPRNESVRVTLNISAFKDNVLDTTFTCTDFPYLPIAG
jgi:hypothetical protein